MTDKFSALGGKVLPAIVLMLLCAFRPAAAQDDRAEAPAEEGRLIVPLSATAMVQRNGRLAASPSRFDTGLVEIGEVESIAITLTHTGGDEPVEIGEASLIGRNASEYTTDFGGFVTLGPGDTVDVGVTFTPASAGQKSAAMTLDITGASAPYVILFDGLSRFPLASDLESSTLTLAFGEATPGETVPDTFELTNLGAEDAPAINVSGIELAGDTPEAFAVQFTPASIAPGESLEIPVTMSSPDAGTKSSDVTIFHDGNNPPVEMRLEGEVVSPIAIPVNFGVSELTVNGVDLTSATAIKFGPGGKLYFSEMTGSIHIADVKRTGKNQYQATHLETIDLVKEVINHDDSGKPDPFLGKRLVTGLLVTGTAAQPVIYVPSSDPRFGAGPPKASSGPDGNDINLDTNSGILHKLTKTGNGWVKQDLVRGLPRSEENHAPNGMVKIDDKLLLVIGGHTNEGAPSFNFASTPEYALSAAILEIDLAAIGTGTYDLPTLDDEDRPGVVDENDPFGGNNGKNQAKLVANGPVQLFASGFRNAYDLVLTESDRLYTFDNGPNSTWGGVPPASCSNAYNDGGRTHADNLHLVTRGSHAGHPNPTRGNTSNTFNASNPQSPVEVAARPVECVFAGPETDGSLTTISSSTNGLVEYTASNFGGAMQGDLIAVAFNGTIHRIQLNGAGDKVTSKSTLSTNTGKTPLSAVAQGDDDPFPGTIWIGHHGVDNETKKGRITIFEPEDY